MTHQPPATDPDQGCPGCRVDAAIEAFNTSGTIVDADSFPAYLAERAGKAAGTLRQINDAMLTGTEAPDMTHVAVTDMLAVTAALNAALGYPATPTGTQVYQQWRADNTERIEQMHAGTAEGGQRRKPAEPEPEGPDAVTTVDGKVTVYFRHDTLTPHTVRVKWDDADRDALPAVGQVLELPTMGPDGTPGHYRVTEVTALNRWGAYDVRVTDAEPEATA